MAYMIQISEDKKEKLSEMCEKMLHYGGKMMQCLESLDEGGDMGFRDDEDEEDWRESGQRENGMRYGMRRGMRGTGRYGRY